MAENTKGFKFFLNAEKRINEIRWIDNSKIPKREFQINFYNGDYRMVDLNPFNNTFENKDTITQLNADGSENQEYTNLSQVFGKTIEEININNLDNILPNVFIDEILKD